VEGRYLLGTTPLEQTLHTLRREYEVDISPEELAERTTLAEAARRGRPGVGSLAGVRDVPEAWRAHVAAVADRPLFQRLYRDQRWRFAAVPVGSLISVQAHLHYGHALRRAGTAASPADVLELCLPVQPEPLECWGGISEGDPPSASFFTRDPNVQVTSVRMETQPLAVTFTIGKTAVFLQVARLDGRLYLKNGTHRAVGLAASGVDLLPCVLVDVEDVDGLPHLLPFKALMGAFPPLVADFLDPSLYVSHVWRDRVKFIRLAPEMFSSALPDREEG